MPDAAPTTPTRPEPATAPPPAAPADDIDLFCPGCGYDLRALRGDACPECGQPIDLDKLRASSIPWVLGEGLLGKAWGFVRTVDRAGLRPTRFCREVARPVSLKHARSFRRVVVLLVWLSVLAAAGADWVFFVYDVGQAGDWGDFFEEAGISQPWAIGTVSALLLLFLVGFTGLHLYAMHPRSLPVERQNRAAALGHYACAPLAALPLIVLMRVVGGTLAVTGERIDLTWLMDLGIVLWAVTFLLIPAMVLVFLRCCYVFAGRAAQRSGFAQSGLFLLLPVLWLGWGLLVFVALPAAVGFVYLFFLTW